MTFLSDKEKEKNNFKLYIFSKKTRDSGSSNDAAGVEMENNGIELHSKNDGTAQRNMEKWRNNVMHMQKIYIDTYLHYDMVCLFACTPYNQPIQHNVLSYLLSEMRCLDTFLPMGIYSFTFLMRVL